MSPSIHSNLLTLATFIVLSVGTVFAQSSQQYFEKGQLRFKGTDNDGWANVYTVVNQWNDEKRRWKKVAEGRTSDGKRDYSLSPGVYQLVMYYDEASPREKRRIDGIQISDKSIVTKEGYFDKGQLRFTGTDNDGWANVPMCQGSCRLN